MPLSTTHALQTVRSIFARTTKDPLLLAASILLVILLAGAVIVLTMTIVSAVSYAAANWQAFDWPLTAPVWQPLSSSLFAIAALFTVIEIILKVLEMIAAIGTRDPFLHANAARLEAIAGGVLWLQLLGTAAWFLRVPFGGDINGLEFAVHLTPAGVAMVLLLFILARVFRHGAAMRQDLEGTV